MIISCDALIANKVVNFVTSLPVCKLLLGTI